MNAHPSIPSTADKLKLGTIERHPVTTRELWLKMRQQDVTASDVASICGVGYRSALAVWAEKKGLTQPTGDSPILQRGRWFEPAIWRAIEDRRPNWRVIPGKIYLRSPSLRFGCTIDALVHDPERDGMVLVQGKIVSKPIWDRDWATPGAEPEVPLNYQLQTLSETMLVEAFHGYKTPVHPVLAALVVDTFSAELHLLPVQRHPEAEQKILATVQKFWSDFEAGRQPAVDPSQDHDTIKALYPRDNGITVDLTADNTLPSLMDQRAALTSEISERELRKKEIETTVKAKLGEASFALIAGGRKVSLKLTKRAGFTVNPTEFRTLREVKSR
jgi:predicted phage-related endonuclease